MKMLTKNTFTTLKWVLIYATSFYLQGCGIHKDEQGTNRRKLVFQDEFNYTGLPDSSKWGYEVGFVRNREPQYYTEKRLDNVRVEDGHLVIEARKEPFVDQKGQKASYTSGSIHTLHKQHFKYGRMEVCAKVPKGLGIWSAIWMLGEDRGEVSWPNCGEIDIMEFVGKDSSIVYGTVHYADSLDKYHSEGKRPVFTAPYADFHTYALEWDEKYIKLFYDDTNYFTFDVSKAQQRDGSNIFKKDYYLLLNLALGNVQNLGGKLHDEALPAQFLIDYIRIYQ